MSHLECGKCPQARHLTRELLHAEFIAPRDPAGVWSRLLPDSVLDTVVLDELRPHEHVQMVHVVEKPEAVAFVDAQESNENSGQSPVKEEERVELQTFDETGNAVEDTETSEQPEEAMEYEDCMDESFDADAKYPWEDMPPADPRVIDVPGNFRFPTTLIWPDEYFGDSKIMDMPGLFQTAETPKNYGFMDKPEPALKPDPQWWRNKLRRREEEILQRSSKYLPPHVAARQEKAAHGKQLAQERKADERKAAEAAAQESDGLEDDPIAYMASGRFGLGDESKTEHTPYGLQYLKTKLIAANTKEPENHNLQLTAAELTPVEPTPAKPMTVDIKEPEDHSLELRAAEPAPAPAEHVAVDIKELENHSLEIRAAKPAPAESISVDIKELKNHILQLRPAEPKGVDPKTPGNHTSEPETADVPFCLDVPTYAPAYIEPESLAQPRLNEITEFQCPFCPRVFDRIKFLNHHLSSTTRTYQDPLLSARIRPPPPSGPVTNPPLSPHPQTRHPSTSAPLAPVSRKPPRSQASSTTSRAAPAA